jgi:predicted MFS family arabinose efflux permease
MASNTPARAKALPTDTRYKIYAYIGMLMMLMASCDPNSGLLDIPVSFLLKSQMKLDAWEISQFRLVISIPLFLSFLFGLARDNWSPFGLGDRGHLLVFSALSAVTYALFAFMGVSIATLLIGLFLQTVWSLFIAAAQNGLTATVGEQHALTGQMSAVWNLFTAIPAALAFLIGGEISDVLNDVDVQSAARVVFLIGAASSLLLVSFAIFRPAAVYNNIRREHDKLIHPWADLKTLAAHRLTCRALLIWTLWNLAPGSATPLQFYLQDALGSSPGQWGQWNALFTAFFIPTFLLYGLLSSRVSAQRLLKWGTIVAIPQFVPMLFANSFLAAELVAIPMGLMGGLASASYVALIMRAAPSGLQGTMMMSASAAYFASTRIGDLLGSALYEWAGNFRICVLFSTAVYASIWFLLPRAISDRQNLQQL